jgi:hypothetical protein
MLNFKILTINFPISRSFPFDQASMAILHNCNISRHLHPMLDIQSLALNLHTRIWVVLKVILIPSLWDLLAEWGMS